jgi:hypothetical protein
MRLLFLNNYPENVNTVTKLKILRSAAGFVEEEVRLVVECIGRLDPVFQGMVGKLSTIHEIHKTARVDFSPVANPSDYLFY